MQTTRLHIWLICINYFKIPPLTRYCQQLRNGLLIFNLSQTNAEGYNALRAEYNQSKSLLDLFVLTCYSFNHQIRFNKQA